MKRNFQKFFLIFINLISLFIGYLIFEYEFSKLNNPHAMWAPTPQTVFFIFSSILIILSISCIAMIFVSMLKKIETPIMQLGKKEINFNKFIIVSLVFEILILGAVFTILNNKTFFVLFPWISF